MKFHFDNGEWVPGERPKVVVQVKQTAGWLFLICSPFLMWFWWGGGYRIAKAFIMGDLLGGLFP